MYFQLTPVHFYSILNQRNLSGFVGEIFANALASEVEHLKNNPHADGRPDLLDLRDEVAAQYFARACFDNEGQPIRSSLAPFPYGGLEVKATIGSGFSRKASEMPIGFERRPFTRRLTYWAHHRHECTLLAIYFDFFAEVDRSPQLCAIFHAAIDSDDWHEVSVGREGSKKTSNTSLTKGGVAKLMNGLVAHSTDHLVVSALERFGVEGSTFH